jgi:REP element-mobilizing transposase RayT
MGRAPRIEYEGAVYHVTNRGNGQEMIYREEADWKAFLGIMSDVASEFGWRIYTYCLMGNHYHLLLETPQPNLSQGMQELDQEYTRRYNWRYEHSGHVFQDRYWPGLVVNDNYLIDAASYLLLNPLRAQLVHSPEEWRWRLWLALSRRLHGSIWTGCRSISVVRPGTRMVHSCPMSGSASASRVRRTWRSSVTSPAEM